eukprot:gene25319-35577_t
MSHLVLPPPLRHLKGKMGGGKIPAIVFGVLAVLGLAGIIVMRVGNSSEQPQPAAHPNTAAHFKNQMFVFTGGGGNSDYSTPNIPTSAELAARAQAASALASLGRVYAVPTESTGEVVVYAPSSSSLFSDAYGSDSYRSTGVQYRPIYATNTDAGGEAGTYGGTGVQYRPIYTTSANTSGGVGSTTYSTIDSNTAAGGGASAATIGTLNYAQPPRKEERPQPAVAHAAGSAMRPTLLASASAPVQ